VIPYMVGFEPPGIAMLAGVASMPISIDWSP